MFYICGAVKDKFTTLFWQALNIYFVKKHKFNQEQHSIDHTGCKLSSESLNVYILAVS